MSAIFLQAEVFYSNFSSMEKSAVSIYSLKIWDKYWENLSSFTFKTLTGTIILWNSLYSIYNPGQNIRNKEKKSSKIGQD